MLALSTLTMATVAMPPAQTPVIVDMDINDALSLLQPAGSGNASRRAPAFHAAAQTSTTSAQLRVAATSTAFGSSVRMTHARASSAVRP